MAATTKPGSRSIWSTLRIPNVFRYLFGSQEAVLFLSLAALILVVGYDNSRFWSTRNMANVFSGNAYIAVAAIGMTMVIVTGNIDISVGSLMVSLAMMSGAISTYHHFPDWLSTDVIILLSWVVPVLAGGGVGAIIGFIVTYLRIPSIVVTLGFLSILKGLLIIISQGDRITDMPEGYALAQRHPLKGIPFPIFENFFHTLTMPVIFMVILVVLAALWMRYSPTGRAMYAVGGNAEAARLSGISEHRIVMIAFILNGLFVGVSSILYATQFSLIQVTLPPIELVIITAAVVGGVSILGGTGTAVGAMLAAILLNAITKGLVFLDISPFWTRAIQGILILVTVLVDLFRRTRQT